MVILHDTKSIHSISDQLNGSARINSNYGYPTSHCFYENATKRFMPCRMKKNVNI